ncbi:MAG TPA: efflux RND transporter periplasmic adaptor subunit [Pirellulales bacterium]|jgi:RND family efflux transporter MFP subunit|nr:efflux RND transporter periplasmic adaptor subunit [Pirellulales bacterium]
MGTTIKRSGRRWGRWLLAILVLGGLAGGGAWGASHGLPGYFAAAEDKHVLTEHVSRGELVVTVVEDGNVESASNIDIKCHVAGGSTILWIVPDGTVVEKGDIIVKLDSATIEDLINAQRIVFERAVAVRIQAEKEYSAAKIAVQEYIEGTFVKELQTCAAQITIAMENLRSAENSLEHTSRLARKGYVTPLQLDAQKFAVERAKLDMETAQVAKNVLEKFTKVKMREDLETTRDTAEARMRSEQAACDLEQTRLKRLMTQMEQCTITAPQDGMVVYANEVGSSRSGSGAVKIEEGAGVRDQQTIVRVPDLQQMQVRALVHESKVDSLAPGMRAEIIIQDRRFHGEVKAIANQPEPTSFFSSSIKEYATYVRIDGEPAGLKPGMTAEVEILVADLKNVLSVPVQAVVEQHGKFYVWAKKGEQIERRPVVIGVTNNTNIEVKDGVAEGEDIVLNPRAVVPSAREDLIEQAQVDIARKFGSAKPRAQMAAKTTPATKAAPTRSGGSPISFSSLDANRDGKISGDEMPERMRSFASQIDTNQDGGVDVKEFAALQSRLQNRGSGEPGSGAPPTAAGGR